MDRTLLRGFRDPADGFDPTDRRWYVLGNHTYAGIPAATAGTDFNQWRIAGETPSPPSGSNTVEGSDEYADPTALEPGHCWPFQTYSATMRSTLTPAGYFPAARDREGVNHYRRFVRLAPRMLGSDARELFVRSAGLLKSNSANGVLDLVFEHNLTTSVDGAGVNTTTFDANKRVGFRFPLTSLGTSELPYEYSVIARAMGPHQSVWHAHLVVGAASNPESSDPAVDLRRGPIYSDLTAAAIDMDLEGSLLAHLFAARGNSATLFQIGSDGGITQDLTTTYVKCGKCVALLSPGR